MKKVKVIFLSLFLVSLLFFVYDKFFLERDSDNFNEDWVVITEVIYEEGSLKYGEKKKIKIKTNKEEVSFKWTTESGSIEGNGNEVYWVAPKESGRYAVTVYINDEEGNETGTSLLLEVVE